MEIVSVGPPAAGRRRFGAALVNAWLALLVGLFLAGPPVDSGERPTVLLLLLAQFYPYALIFLALLAWRRAADGIEGFRTILGVRLLRALEDELARPRAVYLLTVACAGLFLAVSARRHWAFASRGDLAVVDQGLWNTVHGQFWRSSLIPDASLFGIHFEPLQLALAPLYLIAPSSLILLTTQAAVIALGAVPLYWIASRRLPNHPRLWAVFPVAYLAFAPLRNANRFDYHPGALVATLFLFALYFMERSRWGPMVLFLILAGLLKENMPVAGVTVGLYLMATGRRLLLGSAIAFFFGIWFYASFAWLVPAFNPRGYGYFGIYAPLGHSVSSILTAPLVHPGRVLDSLLTQPGWKLGYVLGVFGPVVFLPFLSLEGLFLGLPFLAQHLLATTRYQVNLLTHNSAEVVAFVFFGAVVGAARLLAWLPRTSWLSAWARERASTFLTIAIWSATLLFHGWSEVSYLGRYHSTPRVSALTAALELIPSDAAVAATDYVLPHLAHRARLYWFPPRLSSLPLVEGGSLHDAEFVVVDEYDVKPAHRAAWDAAVVQLTEQGYRPIFERDLITVWRRPAG
jgi:uncharacterized membrane protein